MPTKYSEVPISIELILNSPDIYFRSAKDEATYKFVMTKCKLYVPTIKVRPHIELANSETFKYQPALYPCPRSILNTYTVSSGNHSFVQTFLGWLFVMTVIAIFTKFPKGMTYVYSVISKYMHIYQH